LSCFGAGEWERDFPRRCASAEKSEGASSSLLTVEDGVAGQGRCARLSTRPSGRAVEGRSQPSSRAATRVPCLAVCLVPFPLKGRAMESACWAWYISKTASGHATTPRLLHPRSELAERLGVCLVLRHPEHVEPDSLRQRPALACAVRQPQWAFTTTTLARTDGHRVANRDTERRRDVRREVLVALLVPVWTWSDVRLRTRCRRTHCTWGCSEGSPDG
jgi:hypothetical protein